jgi:hypothetical protein
MAWKNKVSSMGGEHMWVQAQLKQMKNLAGDVGLETMLLKHLLKIDKGKGSIKQTRQEKLEYEDMGGLG